MTPQRDSEPVSGIILAGGFGTRLGGDKAAAETAGRPLLHWTAAALTDLSDDIVVVGRAGQTLPAPPDGIRWRIVDDARSESGPLAGIESGLAAARHDLAAVVATDMPLLAPTLLAALRDIAGESGVGVVMPVRDGRPEPFLAVYHRSCLPAIRAMLDLDERRPRLLLTRVPSRRIDAEALRPHDPDLRSFRNVNTPEELAGVGRVLKSRDSRPAHALSSSAPNALAPSATSNGGTR